jgi:hypothetical protein
MNSYLTFDEYRDMGGLLKQAAFARWGAQAALLIDRATHGRLRNMAAVPEEAKGLAFELIAFASASDPLNTALYVTQESESVDGVQSSRTYSQGRADTLPGAAERMAAMYLDGLADDTGMPLLYMGVRRDD